MTVMHNGTNGFDEILQFVWPLECDHTNFTINDCQDSAILNDENFWLNLTSLTNCGSSSNTSIGIDGIPTFESKSSFFINK